MRKIVNAFALLIALLIIGFVLSPLVETNADVSTSVPSAPVSIDGYTGDMSEFVTDACVVEGQPRILSYNNYGDTVDKKTIMYQRDNGDIAVIYIDRATLGGWYIWASDKIANGVCPE